MTVFLCYQIYIGVESDNLAEVILRKIPTQIIEYFIKNKVTLELS